MKVGFVLLLEKILKKYKFYVFLGKNSFKKKIYIMKSNLKYIL